VRRRERAREQANTLISCSTNYPIGNMGNVQNRQQRQKKLLTKAINLGNVKPNGHK